MSKYEETVDGVNVECPYCGNEYQAESEDFDENERSEECGDCNRSYWLRQTFEIDNWARPDCSLNGVKHDFRPQRLNDGSVHHFCETCGEFSRDGK